MKYELEIASALHLAGGVLPENLDLRQPLVRAVADGDYNAVQTLFSFSSASHVAGTNMNRIPLLIVAVRSLQWVMDKESQGDSSFRRSFTRPQASTAASDAPTRYHSVVKFLLSMEQNPNETDRDGNTALLEALEYEYNADMVDTLLDGGADPQISDERGTTVLHVAAATGHDSLVQLMLFHKVNPNCASHDGGTPISRAAANGHEEIVQLLLQDPTFDATTQSRHDWVRLSQCYNAIKTRNLQQFKDVSTRPLSLAFADRKGQTLLHLAAATGIEEMVSRLLTLGANVNAQDLRGDRPLHIAAASRAPNTAVIRLLINEGADIEAKNYYGDDYGINRLPQDATPLHVAAYTGNTAVIQTLLEEAREALGQVKADSDEPSAPSSPAISPSPMLFQEQRRLSRTQYINLGANGCGRTALMCAVESDHIPAAKILLEHGASVNLSGGGGSWGFTALDLALPDRSGHDQVWNNQGKAEKSEMVKLLESYGAEVFEW